MHTEAIVFLLSYCFVQLYIYNERQLYIVGARPCWAPDGGRRVGVRGDSEFGEDEERTSYRSAFDIYHYTFV